MDTERQVYDRHAVGWQRGLYDDIKDTLRAPIVNWIFRTLMANKPKLLRYVWYQSKPVFQTRAFGEFSVAHRAATLDPIEDAFDVRSYRRSDLDISPAEYRELGWQMATFDVVAPRLAVFFDLLSRSLAGDRLSQADEPDADATVPLPDWLDRDRGRSPTLIDPERAPDEIETILTDIDQIHRLNGGFPSIYRCIAQWPAFLDRAWTDAKPIVTSEVYDEVCDDARSRVETFVETLPYRPRLTPDDLRTVGVSEATIRELVQLFDSFGYDRSRPVLPTLHLYPRLCGADGRRRL